MITTEARRLKGRQNKEEKEEGKEEKKSNIKEKKKGKKKEEKNNSHTDISFLVTFFFVFPLMIVWADDKIRCAREVIVYIKYSIYLIISYMFCAHARSLINQ